MSDLERIVNGRINSLGGIDGSDYRPTGFTVNPFDSIIESYTDTGCRIDNAGNIREGYGSFTGLHVTSWGGIKRGY